MSSVMLICDYRAKDAFIQIIYKILIVYPQFVQLPRVMPGFLSRIPSFLPRHARLFFVIPGLTGDLP